MNSEIVDVVEELRRSRSVPWLRVLDAARLDEPVNDEPDPDAVVSPYRWLLRRVGNGVRLTQAGYLPPAIVSEAMTALGWEDDWIGKHNREDQTLPILQLRETAQVLGLLRKNRGQLLVTKLGERLREHPQQLWWHLAQRLPTVRERAERQAGVLYLLTVAARHPRDDALLAEGMTILGWADGRTRQPISPRGAFSVAADTWSAFRRLGLLPEPARWDDPPEPPTEAGVRLARAALVGPTEPTSTAQSTSTASSAEPEQSPATRVRTGQPMVQLRVSLDYVEPMIWRRLVVPASLTLRQLHAVIQTAMGWEDYHLHMFDVGGVLYGDVEQMDGDEAGDSDTFTVGQAAERVRKFGYEYDFGDSWRHTIAIEQTMSGAGADTPRLIDGARACPPEDCGGPGGYQQLLEVLADPADEEHETMLEWVGGSFDPEAFDLAGTNELLELYDRHTRQRLLERS